MRKRFDSGNNLVEIVDENGNFNSKFTSTFDSLKLSIRGLAYNVVTVLGCQSSGKSTLLNAMFGTKFPEMNSMAGRSQTTKGIWCGCDTESPTLVIDVEGTDSKERGEDRLTFEHRASLFSLAVADAVIINMWYHDIGRYTASNFGLLKTVLGVNLELFQTEPNAEKTHMIFVIRDHSDLVTPLSALQKTLLTDVAKIWDEIKKPLPLQATTADDYFKFWVTSLPSKLAQPEKFKQGVIALKETWLKVKAPTSYSRSIPADGFAMYAEFVWKTIMSSQQLDIPSQKEMVATYRCEEIMKKSLHGVIARLNETNLNISEMFRSNAKFVCDVIRGAIHEYYNEAWRYESNAYRRKRDDLLNAIYVEFQKLYDQYLNEVRQAMLAHATNRLTKMSKKDPFDNSRMVSGESVTEFWAKFSDIIRQWKGSAKADFDEKCLSASISTKIELGDEIFELEHEFSSKVGESVFEEGLDSLESRQRKAEELAFKTYLDDDVDILRKAIECHVIDPDITNYWSKGQKIFETTLSALYSSHHNLLKGILEDESINIGDVLAVLVWESLYELVSRRSDRLPDLVHRRFKKFFDQDANGVPYYWATSSPDEIKRIYLLAKKEAEPIHAILCNFAVTLDRIVSDKRNIPEHIQSLSRKPVLSGLKAFESLEMAQKLMLKSCQEAQFIQATGGRVTKTAWWMWLIVLALAWNEIMWVLRSPVFSMTFITMFLVVLAAWYTNNLLNLVNAGKLLKSFALGALLPLLQQASEDSISTNDRKCSSPSETTAE